MCRTASYVRVLCLIHQSWPGVRLRRPGPASQTRRKRFKQSCTNDSCNKPAACSAPTWMKLEPGLVRVRVSTPSGSGLALGLNRVPPPFSGCLFRIWCFSSSKCAKHVFFRCTNSPFIKTVINCLPGPHSAPQKGVLTTLYQFVTYLSIMHILATRPVLRPERSRTPTWNASPFVRHDQ